MFPGVNLTPGQKVTVVILHVDILSACVHVSVLSKLVAKKKSVSITFLNAILLFQNRDNNFYVLWNVGLNTTFPNTAFSGAARYHTFSHKLKWHTLNVKPLK